VPAGGDLPTTYWDRLTGAEDARTRTLERIEEDEQAVSRLGATALRLDELEQQYRAAGLDREELTARIAARLVPVVETAAELWVPAAIGCHQDHLLTRDAVLAARAESQARPPVHLYADVPYSVHYGWPQWVAGATGAGVDVDYWLSNELEQCGIDESSLVREVRRLDPAEAERKAAAADCYRSQLPALRLASESGPWRQFMLDYEVSWLVRD
jgi:LmbE family N-acetylglucosaminyl deacetylase